MFESFAALRHWLARNSLAREPLVTIEFSDAKARDLAAYAIGEELRGMGALLKTVEPVFNGTVYGIPFRLTVTPPY